MLSTLLLVPVALAAPMLNRAEGTSQRITVLEDSDLCLTANGLAPQAGDVITVNPCEPDNDQYYRHQYWITGGVTSTGPVQVASWNLCIDAGSDTPGEDTTLTLQPCDGGARQDWYWFGGHGLEINNQCWTRENTTITSGVCSGSEIQTIVTSACKSFDENQTFTTS